MYKKYLRGLDRTQRTPYQLLCGTKRLRTRSDAAYEYPVCMCYRRIHRQAGDHYSHPA